MPQRRARGGRSARKRSAALAAAEEECSLSVSDGRSVLDASECSLSDGCSLSDVSDVEDVEDVEAAGVLAFSRRTAASDSDDESEEEEERESEGEDSGGGAEDSEEGGSEEEGEEGEGEEGGEEAEEVERESFVVRREAGGVSSPAPSSIPEESGPFLFDSESMATSLDALPAGDRQRALGELLYGLLHGLIQEGGAHTPIETAYGGAIRTVMHTSVVQAPGVADRDMDMSVDGTTDGAVHTAMHTSVEGSLVRAPGVAESDAAKSVDKALVDMSAHTSTDGSLVQAPDAVDRSMEGSDGNAVPAPDAVDRSMEGSVLAAKVTGMLLETQVRRPDLFIFTDG